MNIERTDSIRDGSIGSSGDEALSSSCALAKSWAGMELKNVLGTQLQPFI